MFDCTTCGNSRANKLVAAEDGLRCDACYVPGTQTGISHQVVIQKYGTKMTYADKMHIKTCTIGRDGKRRPHPRWR